MKDHEDIMGEAALRQALADIDRDPGLVEKLQDLLGEAGHVFTWHASEGIWSVPEGYKDYFSGCLAEIIIERPDLTHRLLKTGNRLIKMLTYRALEIQKEADAKGVTVRELCRLDAGVTANSRWRSRRHN